jgi:hypothetical protein
MTANRAEGAIGEVLGYLRIIENRALHYTCGKDDFITGWIVVGLLFCHISHLSQL